MLFLVVLSTASAPANVTQSSVMLQLQILFKVLAIPIQKSDWTTKILLILISSSSTCFCVRKRPSILLKYIVQELCESRGGCPGLSVLTSLLVSVDVKNY